MVVLGPLNNAGVLPLMPRKWASGCPGVTEETIDEDLELLAASGFVIVDDVYFEVMIRGFISNSGAHRHPNRLRGALNAARLVDSPKLREYLALELHKIDHPDASEVSEILMPRTDLDVIAMGSGSDPDPIGKASETVPEAIEDPSERDLR
jgi:hypothetical protein